MRQTTMSIEKSGNLARKKSASVGMLESLNSCPLGKRLDMLDGLRTVGSSVDYRRTLNLNHGMYLLWHSRNLFGVGLSHPDRSFP